MTPSLTIEHLAAAVEDKIDGLLDRSAIATVLAALNAVAEDIERDPSSWSDRYVLGRTPPAAVAGKAIAFLEAAHEEDRDLNATAIIAAQSIINELGGSDRPDLSAAIEETFATAEDQLGHALPFLRETVKTALESVIDADLGVERAAE
jgi:hypothetical protein